MNPQNSRIHKIDFRSSKNSLWIEYLHTRQKEWLKVFFCFFIKIGHQRLKFEVSSRNETQFKLKVIFPTKPLLINQNIPEEIKMPSILSSSLIICFWQASVNIKYSRHFYIEPNWVARDIFSFCSTNSRYGTTEDRIFWCHFHQCHIVYSRIIHYVAALVARAVSSKTCCEISISPIRHRKPNIMIRVCLDPSFIAKFHLDARILARQIGENMHKFVLDIFSTRHRLFA